ncbi:MAG TPA: hypothetical protein VGF67_24720 [Ktedonobacteraceae bacterium]
MRNKTANTTVQAPAVPGYAFTSIERCRDLTDTIERLHTAGSTHLALVAIHLFYQPTRVLFPMQERRGQSSISLLQSLRPLVRRTDQVFLHRHTCYFVLLQANLQGAQIVEERLWEALLWRVHNMHEYEILRPTHVASGHGAFPDPQTSPEELLRATGSFSKHFAGHANHVLARRSGQAGQEELPGLAKRLGIPYLAALPARLPRRVLHVVSAPLARELRCYPLGRERDTLTVAMLDPQDHQALERLRQETGLRIFPVLTHPEALESALSQFS